MKLVFASSNKNKIRELNALMGEEIELMGLEDIGCKEEIPETAPTIEGNALQKARYVYNHFGWNCFADDTGLEVEALGGKPGVYSARYAGEEKNADKNMQKVLKELSGQTNRKARFRTVIALIIEGKELCFEGEVNGEILEAKQGEMGFGYDPVFRPEGSVKSFAEMNLEEKNKISHRALAVNKLVDYLKFQISLSGA
jgi:XTP/dITP diphosphohydrolase